MTTLTINDKMVFAQMFKSFGQQGLDVVEPMEDVFNKDGYIDDVVHLCWSGRETDGFKIKRVIEFFGYKVEWDGDRARTIDVFPVSPEELATR